MTAWVIGNWKLNPATLAEAVSLATAVTQKGSDFKKCQLMIAPSLVHLSPIADIVQSTSIQLASQDISALCDSTGAYTGDCSAVQVQNLGTQWVIIGHSERREYYNETNEWLLKKLMYCQQHNMGTIFCIGETADDYLNGRTKDVLISQLDVIVEYIRQSQVDINTLMQRLIIAYEPVWAIGTGKVPSPQQVADIHQSIRDHIGQLVNNLENISIIYGGSVKPDNAASFAAELGIDGVLVGGAALSAESFLTIAQAFEAAC